MQEVAKYILLDWETILMLDIWVNTDYHPEIIELITSCPEPSE